MVATDAGERFHRASLRLLRDVRTHAAPDWLTREDIAAGRLVELAPGYELPEQGIFAVRPRAGHVPAKVRRFVDFLRAFVNAEATIAPGDRDRISKSAW